jgi:hypothetical protein
MRVRRTCGHFLTRSLILFLFSPIFAALQHTFVVSKLGHAIDLDLGQTRRAQ